MAQSRVSAADDEGIGTRGADLGAWDKLQLGWLDYEVVAGRPGTHAQPRPARVQLGQAQGVVVVLPEEAGDHRTTALRPRARGSGGAVRATTSTTRWHGRSTLPAAPATLTFQARWNIEDCGPDPCDYAYVEVSTDGSTWTAIPGSITKAAEGNGIDGTRRRGRPRRSTCRRTPGRRSACGSGT